VFDTDIDLGIVSGSAMFRIQASDGLIGSAAPSTTPPPAPPQQPHVSFARTTTVPPAPAPPVHVPKLAASSPAPQAEDVDMEDAHIEEKDANAGNNAMSSYDALQLLRERSFDAVSRTAVTMLMKIVTNILSDPGLFSVLSAQRVFSSTSSLAFCLYRL